MTMRAIAGTTLLTLLMLVVLTPSLMASFENRARRAASAHTMLRKLHQHFDKAQSISGWCSTINQGNFIFLGENDPTEGKPVLKDPGAPFLTWLFVCGGEYFRDDFRHRYTDPDVERYLSAKAFAQLKDAAAKNPSAGLDVSSRLQVLKAAPWGRLPASSRQAIATDLVHDLIGPGVIADEGKYVREVVALADRTPDAVVIDAELSMALKIIGSADFINY